MWTSSEISLFQGVVDDVTRSSPEDGDETSDDDDNYCTSCQLKPILVCPGNDDGEETINLMFPKKSEKKASFELDDVDFRALTKQNTMRNRVSVTSLKSSDVRMWYKCIRTYSQTYTV